VENDSSIVTRALELLRSELCDAAVSDSRHTQVAQ
jgi:hypothetical protein